MTAHAMCEICDHCLCCSASRLQLMEEMRPCPGGASHLHPVAPAPVMEHRGPPWMAPDYVPEWAAPLGSARHA